MKYSEKIKNCSKGKIWSEYCGFLDLDMDAYMYIQNRLMEEQISRWKKSGLGKKLLKGKDPRTVEEFRSLMPLTDYADYADTLLNRQEEMLPEKPSIWIQTTWEGGIRPIKLAPYGREMLNVYRHNMLSVAMLASSHGKGDYSLQPGDRVLYGGAPLPYATGLIPSLLDEELDLKWLPDENDTGKSFSGRIKEGFSMAKNGGIDYFFGIGSVANYITDHFSVSGSGKGHSSVSPEIAYRYLKASYRKKKTGSPILPKDIFHLKGLISAGTDAACYRSKLQHCWGVVPMEIAAGTESTCIGTETYEHNGMVFFPNAGFYEFISESELQRERELPGYIPRTCLMNEIQAGQNYELVLSIFHGGAFMRYRIGDIYRCVQSKPNHLPHLTFLDRTDDVIDIAGFTRITESSVKEALALSKIRIGSWFMKKEYSSDGIPFLHMYMELPEDTPQSETISLETLKEHLSVYFKYFDSDYSDLKKMLGMDPLNLSVLRQGSIAYYEKKAGRKIRKINPDSLDVADILKLQDQMKTLGGRSMR